MFSFVCLFQFLAETAQQNILIFFFLVAVYRHFASLHVFFGVLFHFLYNFSIIIIIGLELESKTEM